MNQTIGSADLTMTVRVPDGLSAAAPLLRIKHAEALGVIVVSFDWPQPETVPLAA